MSWRGRGLISEKLWNSRRRQKTNSLTASTHYYFCTSPHLHTSTKTQQRQNRSGGKTQAEGRKTNLGTACEMPASGCAAELKKKNESERKRKTCLRRENLGRNLNLNEARKRKKLKGRKKWRNGWRAGLVTVATTLLPAAPLLPLPACALPHYDLFCLCTVICLLFPFIHLHFHYTQFQLLHLPTFYTFTVGCYTFLFVVGLVVFSFVLLHTVRWLLPRSICSVPTFSLLVLDSLVVPHIPVVPFVPGVHYITFTLFHLHTICSRSRCSMSACLHTYIVVVPRLYLTHVLVWFDFILFVYHSRCSLPFTLFRVGLPHTFTHCTTLHYTYDLVTFYSLRSLIVYVVPRYMRILVLTYSPLFTVAVGLYSLVLPRYPFVLRFLVVLLPPFLVVFTLLICLITFVVDSITLLLMLCCCSRLPLFIYVVCSLFVRYRCIPVVEFVPAPLYRDLEPHYLFVIVDSLPYRCCCCLRCTLVFVRYLWFVYWFGLQTRFDTHPTHVCCSPVRSFPFTVLCCSTPFHRCLRFTFTFTFTHPIWLISLHCCSDLFLLLLNRCPFPIHSPFRSAYFLCSLLLILFPLFTFRLPLFVVRYVRSFTCSFLLFTLRLFAFVDLLFVDFVIYIYHLRYVVVVPFCLGVPVVGLPLRVVCSVGRLRFVDLLRLPFCVALILFHTLFTFTDLPVALLLIPTLLRYLDLLLFILFTHLGRLLLHLICCSLLFILLWLFVCCCWSTFDFDSFTFTVVGTDTRCCYVCMFCLPRCYIARLRLYVTVCVYICCCCYISRCCCSLWLFVVRLICCCWLLRFCSCCCLVVVLVPLYISCTLPATTTLLLFDWFLYLHVWPTVYLFTFVVVVVISLFISRYLLFPVTLFRLFVVPDCLRCDCCCCCLHCWCICCLPFACTFHTFHLDCIRSPFMICWFDFVLIHCVTVMFIYLLPHTSYIAHLPHVYVYYLIRYVYAFLFVGTFTFTFTRYRVRRGRLQVVWV